MTARGAASSGSCFIKIDGKTPFAKRDMVPDQFFIFPGMNLMTGPAGSSFLQVHMKVKKKGACPEQPENLINIATFPRTVPVFRYCGIFSNRWKDQYLALASIALNQNQSDSSDSKEKSSSSPAPPSPAPPSPASLSSSLPSWAKRQKEDTGINPLICPNCNQELTFVGAYFGNWKELQLLFETVGKDTIIPLVLLSPG
jgi:hypothetical protein